MTLTPNKSTPYSPVVRAQKRNSPSREPTIRSNSAAGFLLQIAGRGTDRSGRANFIVMGDDAPRPSDPRDRKYDTVFRHPTLCDVIGHLAGRITMGGYLAHGEQAELARAICYDADDSVAFARLGAAAEHLRACGARPFLEQANLPSDSGHAGGGKLWLVFSGLVAWRDAQASAEHYAPGLSGLERFPSGRVRLPGGMYRRGVNVWSELCCPGAADPNWYTGELAIQTIMENLTPVTWVTVRRVQAVKRPTEVGEERPIPVHQRNKTLFSLGGTMRRRGMSHAAIEAALLAENTARCRPPLDLEEVRELAARVSGYAPAKDVQRTAQLRVREVNYA